MAHNLRSYSTPAFKVILFHNTVIDHTNFVARFSTPSSRTVEGGFYILGIIICILGFSYASVPLYQIYCQVTGFGGTVQTSFPFYSSSLNFCNKQISVYFNADQNDSPCFFKPQISKIKVYPGDTALIFYIASNQSNHPVVGVSTYHVTPQKVGIYFNKIQCFCFQEQRFKPHETIEMPILFFIDSDFYKDPKMSDVDTITLPHTS